MRRRAALEQVDDALRLGCEMRQARQSTDGIGRGAGDIGEAHRTEPERRPRQEMASRESKGIDWFFEVHRFHTVASRFNMAWQTTVSAARATGSRLGSLLRSPTPIKARAAAGSEANNDR